MVEIKLIETSLSNECRHVFGTKSGLLIARVVPKVHKRVAARSYLQIKFNTRQRNIQVVAAAESVSDPHSVTDQKSPFLGHGVHVCRSYHPNMQLNANVVNDWSLLFRPVRLSVCFSAW